MGAAAFHPYCKGRKEEIMEKEDSGLMEMIPVYSLQQGRQQPTSNPPVSEKNIQLEQNSLSVHGWWWMLRNEYKKEKKELMMLANISPCISILFRKWLSGSEAAWSSIASDSRLGCDCPLDRAGLLLTNPAHRGRDEDALLSVPGGVRLFSWHSW